MIRYLFRVDISAILLMYLFVFDDIQSNDVWLVLMILVLKRRIVIIPVKCVVLLCYSVLLLSVSHDTVWYCW